MNSIDLQDGFQRSWSDLCREFGPVEIITPDGDA